MDIISEGPYLERVCSTVGNVRQHSEKCAECKWFEVCTGGCRALGLLYSGARKDFLGEDITKCLYFEKGWYEKTLEVVEKWGQPYQG